MAKELWVGVEREVVEGEFVKLANLMGRFSRVNVCVCGAERDRVQELLREATVLAIETDNVWCRDHGPTFLKNGQSGEVAGLSVEALPFVGGIAEGVEGSYANFLIVHEGVIVPQ